MNARHHLIDSPELGRRQHVWTFGTGGNPLVVFPSNAGVAHEWRAGGMIDALTPLLRTGRVKVYCPETNVSRSFSGEGSVNQRMAHHNAYEYFVMKRLVPFIREDLKNPRARMVATGCSVGALYSSIFALKHPETFKGTLCLSGRYRTSWFFDDVMTKDVYFNDPFAFVPNLRGAALERVRRHAHFTLVVGRGAHEDGCIPETLKFGELLRSKGIPHHLALWGTDSSHTYPWWQKQAQHYLSQMF